MLPKLKLRGASGWLLFIFLLPCLTAIACDGISFSPEEFDPTPDSFPIIAPEQACAPIKVLNATGIGNGPIKVSWTPPLYASSYGISVGGDYEGKPNIHLGEMFGSGPNFGYDVFPIDAKAANDVLAHHGNIHIVLHVTSALPAGSDAADPQHSLIADRTLDINCFDVLELKGVSFATEVPPTAAVPTVQPPQTSNNSKPPAPSKVPPTLTPIPSGGTS